PLVGPDLQPPRIAGAPDAAGSRCRTDHAHIRRWCHRDPAALPQALDRTDFRDIRRRRPARGLWADPRHGLALALAAAPRRRTGPRRAGLPDLRHGAVGRTAL